MTTRNKRVSLKKQNLVEQRLKDKLKSNYKKSLKEADEDLSDDADLDDENISDDDIDTIGDESLEGNDNNDIDFSDEDQEDLDDEDEFDFDSLNDDQKEWFDDEVDELLEPAAEELEAEEHSEGDDLNIESDSDDLELSDSPFSADELNSIIASDDTLHDLEGELTDLAKEEDFDEDDLDLEDEDDEDDEDEMLEAELMTEAEIEHELNEKVNFAKRRGLRKESDGKNFPVKKKGLEWEEEDDPETEGAFTTVKQPTEGHAKGVAETKAGLNQKMKNLRRESIEKSKMLVLAANKIKNLAEANSRLKLENMKLLKANGILAAVGNKLDDKSRRFVAESFSKCKTEKHIKALYEKIVKAIKEKAKSSLNETVNRKVKTKTSNLIINNKKEVLNESTNTDKISFAMQRKLHLMGLQGGDDAYYNNY